MRLATMLIAALALSAGVGSAQASVEAEGPPGWMAGCWIEQSGQKWAEECWTAPRAGTMLGASRVGEGTTLSSWEAAQILPDASGRLTFWASPNGGTRVPFALVSRSATEAVFANPAHDYPQRIRYWREGAMLNAEISLLDGSKLMRWRFSAQR